MSDSRSKPDRAETENTGSVHESGGAKQSPITNLNNPLPPVGLDELEQRARELLATELYKVGFEREAAKVLELDFHEFNTFGIALRAIVAALQSPLSGEEGNKRG